LGGSLVLVAVVVAWQPLGAPAAVAVNVVATACALLLTDRLLRRALPAPAYAVRAEYLTRTWGKVGWSLLLVSGLVLILHQTDIFLVGAFMGTTKAGIYYTASRVATLAVFGMIAISAIAAPMFSEFYSQNRTAELQRVVTLAARGILAFSVPVSLGLVVWGEPVLALFGPDFTQAYWALVILTIGQLYNAATGVAGFLMSMTGHQRMVARVYGVSAVLNVVLNACLIPIWGIEGSAIATTTTTIVWNTILVVYVWKRLGLRVTAV
jgi:O-antigen/teichoic acid export membrane protein